MQTFYHNIGFWEKRQFFWQKLSKIAENCDHNIDPGSDESWGKKMAEGILCFDFGISRRKRSGREWDE
jgi:hypothetical protein